MMIVTIFEVFLFFPACVSSSVSQSVRRLHALTAGTHVTVHSKERIKENCAKTIKDINDLLLEWFGAIDRMHGVRDFNSL